MKKGKNRFIIFFITILHVCLLTGCFFNKEPNDKKLYFEPQPKLIEDCTGMVEGADVNWSWLKLGVRLSRYPSITIKPFKNLTSIDDQMICERLHQELTTWFKKNDIALSDNGQIICEGAVVELKLERDFINSVNPLYEEQDDLFLELELVIREKTTHDAICKIRHGAVGSEVDIIVEQVLAGLIRYFESHK